MPEQSRTEHLSLSLALLHSLRSNKRLTKLCVYSRYHNIMQLVISHALQCDIVQQKDERYWLYGTSLSGY